MSSSYEQDSQGESVEYEEITEEEPVGPLLSPQVFDRHLLKKREALRGVIAIILLSLLCGVVVLTYIGFFFTNRAVDDISRILELLMAPLVGLVGAVTGFYFGEKSRE